MKKIAKSLLSITLVLAVVTLSSSAFFSDIETSFDNLFLSGDIDAKISYDGYYNEPVDGTPQISWEFLDLTEEKFFNFDDLKPGDYGEGTIGIRVDSNDAWACMEINGYESNDPNLTEPESLIDNTQGDGQGEMHENLHFYAWVDDGDNIWQTDEELLFENYEAPAQDFLNDNVIPLADSNGNVFDGAGPLSGEQEYFLGIAWCFGDMDVDQNTGAMSCNGEPVDNSAQTDEVLADVSFQFLQARNNLDFECIECTVEEVLYGDSVLNANQGLKKSGAAVDANRSIEANVLGAPEGTQNPPNWYSLGFDGRINIELAQPAADVAGIDLIIYESTNGRNTYPLERARIRVSQDGSTWHTVGEARSTNANGESGFDISGTGLEWFKYVRVRDLTNPNLHINSADAFDLDAISVLAWDQCVEPELQQ